MINDKSISPKFLESRFLEMARALVEWEKVATEREAMGEGDPLEDFRAFKSGLLLSRAVRLAKGVLGEGEIELPILKRVEEIYQQAEADSRALATLRAAAQAVIEQAELDAAIGLGNQFSRLDLYEIVLTSEQVEALRVALAGGEE